MNKARFVLLLAVTVFITGCTFPQVPWPWDGPITLPEPEPGDQPVPEDPDTGEHPEPDTGSSQFLWKPKAENDGKLVCITPARYRTKSSQSACKEYTVTKAAVVMVKDEEIIQREAKVSYFPGMEQREPDASPIQEDRQEIWEGVLVCLVCGPGQQGPILGNQGRGQAVGSPGHQRKVVVMPDRGYVILAVIMAAIIGLMVWDCICPTPKNPCSCHHTTERTDGQ